MKNKLSANYAGAKVVTDVPTTIAVVKNKVVNFLKIYTQLRNLLL